MPRLVQLMRIWVDSAVWDRVAGSKPARLMPPPAAWHRAEALAASRAHTVTRLALARSSAGATERAAPPAPRRVTERSATAWPCCSSAATKPSPSVLKPQSCPSRRQTVFTEPVRSALPSRRSTSSYRACLWGMVALKPVNSPARTRSRKAGSSSAATCWAV